MKSAPLSVSAGYTPPAMVTYGSIVDNTFSNGAGNVFPGFSVAALHCNSGRGNGPEPSGSSSTWIDPHDGGTGPGSSPTGDCDPGNSGPHDAGGD